MRYSSNLSDDVKSKNIFFLKEIIILESSIRRLYENWQRISMLIHHVEEVRIDMGKKIIYNINCGTI